MRLSIIRGSCGAASSLAAAISAASPALLHTGRQTVNSVLGTLNEQSIGSIVYHVCFHQGLWSAAGLLQQYFSSASAAGGGWKAGGSSPKSMSSRLHQLLQEEANRDSQGLADSSRSDSATQSDAADTAAQHAEDDLGFLQKELRDSSSCSTSQHDTTCCMEKDSTSNSSSTSSNSSAWGRQVQGTGQGLHPKLLTARIKKASAVGQLQQLVQQHGASMDYIHLSAAVNMLGNWQRDGRLRGRQQQQHVQQLLADIEALLAPEVLNLCGCCALARLVWGLGLLGHTHTGIFQRCVDQYLQQVDEETSAIGLSHVLYTVANVGWPLEPQQLQQLLAALLKLLPVADPQAVSNSLWAAAKLGQQLEYHQQQQLQQSPHVQQLLAGLAGKLPAAGAQAVSNSLWACAQLRISPGELFAALDSQQQWDRLAPAMNGQELANTALACAGLNHKHEQLLECIVQQAVQRQSSSSSRTMQLNQQALCNLVWAVAMLDLSQVASHVVELVQRACNQQHWTDLVPEDLSQLQQVHQWLLDRQLLSGRGLAGALTEQQLQQCKKASADLLKRSAAGPPSAFQQQVFTALRQLTAAGGLSWQQPPAMEQLAVPDGACVIDIAGVTADGVQLAIEVDGPVHFLWPDSRLDGRTQHRNRVLQVRGYSLISVPYFEWDGLMQGLQGQQQYLLQLINRAIQQQQVRSSTDCPPASSSSSSGKGQQQQPQVLEARQKSGTKRSGQKRSRGSTHHHHVTN